MKFKKYIKNYKNNNLPETLFLVGVFILSMGLFIEPKSSWFLGIYFYKSDLTTITTISKIIGTVIISSSIILNLKKYTNRDNGKLNERSKLLEEEEIEKEPKIDIEKTKKSLKYTGGLIYAVGWLTLVINSIYYLLNIFGISLSESEPSTPIHSIFFISILIPIVFIIIGKRIKVLNDKRTKSYLQIIVLLSFLFFILIAYTGGTVGILFFILTGYLISSLFKISKAMRVKEFTSTLTNPKYKLDKYGWGYFIGTSVVVLMILLVIDSNTSKIDLGQVYEAGKPDLSYEGYLKEKDASGVIYDELDKQKIIPSVKTETNKINTSNTSNWITYTSKEDNFSVLFPKLPDYEEFTIPKEALTKTKDNSTHIILNEPLNAHNYGSSLSSNSSSYYFYIDVYSFPDYVDVSNPKDFLNNIYLNQQSYSPETSPVSLSQGMYKQHYSLNILTRDKYTVTNKRFILIGHKVYVLQILVSAENYAERVYDEFINSFKTL